MRNSFVLAFTVMLWLGMGLAPSCDDDDDSENDTTDDDAGDDDDDNDFAECTSEDVCRLRVDCTAVGGTMEECLAAGEAQLQDCINATSFMTCLCKTVLDDPSCHQYFEAFFGCSEQFCWE
jgi:hypothetical protein